MLAAKITILFALLSIAVALKISPEIEKDVLAPKKSAKLNVGATVTSYFEQGHHGHGGHGGHDSHHGGHGSANAAYWEHFNNHVAPNLHGHGDSGHDGGHHGAGGHGHLGGGHHGESHGYVGHGHGHYGHSKSGYEVKAPNFVQWNYRY